MIDEKILIGTGLSREFIYKEQKLNRILADLNSVCLERGARYALFGGTAVNKIYLDCPRFSEDLDFHLFNTSPSKTQELLESISGVFVGKPERIFRGFYRFPLQYSDASQGIRSDVINADINLSLKKPVSKVVFARTKSFIEKYDVEYASGVRIPTYKIETLIAMKLLALSSRCEGKDLFDVWGLFSLEFDVAVVMDELFKYQSSFFDFFRITPGFFSDLIELLKTSSESKLSKYDSFILMSNRPDWSSVKTDVIQLISTRFLPRFRRLKV